MLRISIVESGARRRLVLEGKLVPPWTEELKAAFKRSKSEVDHFELVVDVRGLTVISQEGEEVLLALMLHGARFRGSDVFTKQIFKQLARRAQQLGKNKPQGSGY